MLSYVRDLQQVLKTGSLSEQKMFLAGVIKRIVVYDEGIEIEYRLPQPRKREKDELLPAVLHSVDSGGGERARTADLRLAKPALSQAELRPHSQGTFIQNVLPRQGI